MTELYFMQLLSQASQPSWMSVIYLCGLFAICLWQPQRVRSPFWFRWGCTLFALSIIVPPIMQACLAAAGIETMVLPMDFRRSSMQEVEWLVILARTIGPVLFGLSLMATFAAITPRPAVVVPRPAESPAPHPLD